VSNVVNTICLKPKRLIGVIFFKEDKNGTISETVTLVLVPIQRYTITWTNMIRKSLLIKLTIARVSAFGYPLLEIKSK